MDPTVDPPTASRWAAVRDVISSRRTSLFVDPDRPVPRELVDAVCDVARWAPCHKRTWPWMFASFSGDARRRLGDAAADALATLGEDPARVAKTRTKYLRAPVVVAVGVRHGDDAIRTAENRDAAAAAVQNVLLAATAAGLASYWSSCPYGADRAVADVARFPQPTSVIAIVYLGWPTRPCPAPDRPDVAVLHLD